MITVVEYPHIKVYWYDQELSILIADIEKGWTWDIVHQALGQLNELVAEQSKKRSIYVILNFGHRAQTFPKGYSPIKNMRKILRDDPSNETLTICVSRVNIWGNIIALASRIYRVAHNQSKFRYVATLEQALEIVEAHKISHGK